MTETLTHYSLYISDGTEESADTGWAVVVATHGEDGCIDSAAWISDPVHEDLGGWDEPWRERLAPDIEAAQAWAEQDAGRPLDWHRDHESEARGLMHGPSYVLTATVQ